jgi:hypothetical protein
LQSGSAAAEVGFQVTPQPGMVLQVPSWGRSSTGPDWAPKMSRRAELSIFRQGSGIETVKVEERFIDHG